MPAVHSIRVGALGHIGRFAAVDAVRYPRGARVIVRTSRGLEAAEVLSVATHPAEGEPDGTILRGIAVEDDLLLARLQHNRRQACEACTELLAERGIAAVLLDVEQLFDGQTLVFYFLGETPPEADALTAALAERYEANVQFRRFSEAVATGCGPACGTDDAAGCGVGGGCATSCALAGKCAAP